MKNIIILIALFFSIKFSYAQVQDPWQLIKTVDNVSAYYQQVQCNGQNMLMLKFVSNDDSQVKVTWSLWKDLPNRSIILKSKEIREGGCTSGPAYILMDRIPAGLTTSDIVSNITVLKL